MSWQHCLADFIAFHWFDYVKLHSYLQLLMISLRSRQVFKLFPFESFVLQGIVTRAMTSYFSPKSSSHHELRSMFVIALVIKFTADHYSWLIESHRYWDLQGWDFCIFQFFSKVDYCNVISDFWCLHRLYLVKF